MVVTGIHFLNFRYRLFFFPLVTMIPFFLFGKVILHLNLSFDHQTPSVALNGGFKKSDVGTFWKNCSCGQVGFLSTTMRSNLFPFIVPLYSTYCRCDNGFDQHWFSTGHLLCMHLLH